MAEEASVNAVIRFGQDHRLHTSSTPEQIENAIRANTNPVIPLIQVELPTGGNAMVNAAQIRVIESPSGSTAEDIVRIEQM
jgi:hypothetical protein